MAGPIFLAFDSDTPWPRDLAAFSICFVIGVAAALKVNIERASDVPLEKIRSLLPISGTAEGSVHRLFTS
jgi:hypothetical protein